MAQIITLENPKLGPDNNFTAYIYIYAVGSITGPHLGVLESMAGPHVGLITGPHHFHSIEVVVSEDFLNHVFRDGVQTFRRFLVFWSKSRLLKKGMVATPFFIFLLWWLLVNVSTRL